MTLRAADVSVPPSHNPGWCDRSPPPAAKRAALRWCWAHGYVEQNVAGEEIEGALPAMPAVKEHFRALPYREVSEALEAVQESRVSDAAKLCLRFLVLTSARSGEARGATCAEIDLETREWRIPGERMKKGREHRVPLSDAACDVLAQARLLAEGSELVFPSPTRTGQPLSNMTLTKILRDRGLAERATVHGFRSAFRDWCAETGKPREIAAFRGGGNVPSYSLGIVVKRCMTTSCSLDTFQSIALGCREPVRYSVRRTRVRRRTWRSG